MRVSVVVAAFNASRCITRALDSALSQNRPPDEVIVCDDGSSDGTADCIERRYGAAVTLVRLPHRNASSARRAAIQRAHGNWLAFLDADDRWLPGKLERQIAFLERHPQVRWLTTDGRYVSDQGVLRESWLSDYFAWIHDVAGDLLEPLLHRCFPLMSSALVERGAYDGEGGFDPGLTTSHDYDLWLRLAARHPGGLMADRTVEYYSGPGTLSNDRRRRMVNDLTIMRRVERSGLGRGEQVRRLAADRAAALEFDIAVLDLRAGHMSEAREHLRRSLAAGPCPRRLAAAAGLCLPGWAIGLLGRSPLLRGALERARRGAVTLPAPVAGTDGREAGPARS